MWVIFRDMPHPGCDFASPFEVLRRVFTNAYQLQLPPAMVTAQVHDVFNVSQLRLFLIPLCWTQGRTRSIPMTCRAGARRSRNDAGRARGPTLA